MIDEVKLYLKQVVLRGLDRALQTEALHSAVLKHVEDAGYVRRTDLAELTLGSDPYTERNAATHRVVGDSEPTPIFVTARFRSGSTALWNVFRNTAGCTAFYEPFNERKFFDRSTRGNHVDGTHRGVNDYWREYEQISGLDAHYDEDWTRRRLYMDEHSWAPEMKAYIDTLIDGANGRAVLQFNRMDFRLGWVRANYPSALVVHLYRDPRAQWLSTLFGDKNFGPESSPGKFVDHFYLRSWVRDLKHVFPFLSDRASLHPYRQFYFLWKLSWLFGQRYANTSVSFERLTANPQEVLLSLFSSLGIDDPNVRSLASLLTSKEEPRGPLWREWADDDWYLEHETHCDAVLKAFFVAESSNSNRQSRGQLSS